MCQSESPNDLKHDTAGAENFRLLAGRLGRLGLLQKIEQDIHPRRAWRGWMQIKILRYLIRRHGPALTHNQALEESIERPRHRPPVPERTSSPSNFIISTGPNRLPRRGPALRPILEMIHRLHYQR